MYEVTYHRDLAQDRKEFDLLTIAEHRKLVARLEESPQRGKPLRHGLKGYWRLRVGNLRVAYRIREPDLVVILAIGARRDSEIYELAMKRADR